MKVLVCGGREFTDKNYLFTILSRLHQVKRINTLIEGDARGADKLAGEWAELFDVPLMKFPADWDLYGKYAGFRRNIEMLNEKPDLVLGFNPGLGTNHTLTEAVKRKIKIIVFKDKNIITKEWMKDNNIVFQFLK